MKDIIISVDFDGTVVTPEFPKIGSPVGAGPALKFLQDNGCKIILWTVRSHGTGGENNPQNKSFDGTPLHEDVLDAASSWFDQYGISLYGINENPDQQWSSSPKAYATDIIDDYCVGIPLFNTPKGPVVDWVKVLSFLCTKYSFTMDPKVIEAIITEQTALNA